MKTQLDGDRIDESDGMTNIVKHDEEDEDDYSEVLPSNDDYSSVSSYGHESLNRGSFHSYSSKPDPDGSSSLDIGSSHSYTSKPDPDGTKYDKKKTNKKQEQILKIDYSGLSIGALKLELETCGVSTEGLTEKAELVTALEDFKTAETKTGKSPTKSPKKSPKKISKLDRNENWRQIEFSSSGSIVDRSSSTGSPKKYAENDQVLYVSSNGDSESATILKVHLDDQLVPFYDIKLHSSDREKQTDDAHLKPLVPRRKKSKPAKSSEPPPRRSSMDSMGSLRSPKSVKAKKKAYAENDKVLYVSSNGDNESATILKVHMDDQLVPFYDIRLHSSGREKQTDDAHLKPARQRKRPPVSKASGQPPRRSSMGSLRNSSARASTEYSLTPDQLTNKKSQVPRRRTSLTFGNSLPDGFVSPPQGKRSTVQRKKTKSMGMSEQMNSPNSFVSPLAKRAAVPRRNSLAAQSMTSPRSAKSVSRRGSSDSAMPKMDRLDLTSSPAGVKPKRSKELRRRSFDNSGGSDCKDYKVVSPTPRSSTKSLFGKAKNLVKIRS